ncbi:hypothetical protein D9611_010504 [Ephemerocybe angulata]|uniref:Uncharacterized protein n=1 Tax=Ephemerocybe angulata TaxID=980116 RepID=A0A8H5BUR0_9AGAR|nr:hypothetical protein D9611_010504 [Tulosesus angulatus]
MFTMFYARLLVVSFICTFLFCSVVAAPTGRGSASLQQHTSIDSETPQVPPHRQLHAAPTPVDFDAGAAAPVVIHEETHTFNWVPATSKPSDKKPGTFHEIVRIFLGRSSSVAKPPQVHQKWRRMARRRHP